MQKLPEEQIQSLCLKIESHVDEINKLCAQFADELGGLETEKIEAQTRIAELEQEARDNGNLINNALNAKNAALEKNESLEMRLKDLREKYNNGFENWEALRKENAALKAQLESDYIEAFVTPITELAIPDWIAPGKWVEFSGNRQTKIKSVTAEYVYYENGEYNGIEYVKSYSKPFTPPPCPQLPNGFDGKIHHPAIKFAGVTSSVHGWIAMMEASPDNWGNQEERLAVLIAYRDHIEKWG